MTDRERWEIPSRPHTWVEVERAGFGWWWTVATWPGDEPFMRWSLFRWTAKRAGFRYQARRLFPRFEFDPVH